MRIHSSLFSGSIRSSEKDPSHANHGTVKVIHGDKDLRQTRTKYFLPLHQKGMHSFLESACATRIQNLDTWVTSYIGTRLIAIDILDNVDRDSSRASKYLTFSRAYDFHARILAEILAIGIVTFFLLRLGFNLVAVAVAI